MHAMQARHLQREALRPHHMPPYTHILIVPAWAANASLYLVENDQICGGCVLGIFSQNCGCNPEHTGRVMRISDDRYSRERLCLDLALRFLRHEARTQTIRTWTGLTDDRIRKVIFFRFHVI
jgi:hypothetical protein